MPQSSGGLLPQWVSLAWLLLSVVAPPQVRPQRRRRAEDGDGGGGEVCLPLVAAVGREQFYQADEATE